MKKLLITFAVGLVLGLGGSTVAVGYFGGEQASLTDSLAAATVEDSPAAHPDTASAGDEHGAEGEAAAESLGGDDGDAAPVADPIPVVPGGAAGAAPSVAMASSNGGEPPMETARLAKLFASMQAREAARVLEHMDDDEVQIILTQLGNREAAAILSNLTPERAAVISRTVIRGERSIQ